MCAVQVEQQVRTYHTNTFAKKSCTELKQHTRCCKYLQKPKVLQQLSSPVRVTCSDWLQRCKGLLRCGCGLLIVLGGLGISNNWTARYRLGILMRSGFSFGCEHRCSLFSRVRATVSWVWGRVASGNASSASSSEKNSLGIASGLTTTSCRYALNSAQSSPSCWSSLTSAGAG